MSVNKRTYYIPFGIVSFSDCFSIYFKGEFSSFFSFSSFQGIPQFCVVFNNYLICALINLFEAHNCRKNHWISPPPFRRTPSWVSVSVACLATHQRHFIILRSVCEGGTRKDMVYTRTGHVPAMLPQFVASKFMPQSSRSSLYLLPPRFSDIYDILCGISDEQLNVACRGREQGGQYEDRVATISSQRILHYARYYHQITLTCYIMYEQKYKVLIYM